MGTRLDALHLRRIGLLCQHGDACPPASIGTFLATEKAFPKILLLLRHGESEAQRCPQAERWHPDSSHLRDPCLSDLGVVQAKALSDTFTSAALAPDTVLCSPLTRAVTTAALAFGDTRAPIVAVPELREMPQAQRSRQLRDAGFVDGALPQQWECVGRSTEEVLRDLAAAAASSGVACTDWAARIDWRQAAGEWWNRHEEVARGDDRIPCALGGDLGERLAAARNVINSVEQRRVAVVAHFNVLRRLAGIRRKLTNCTPIYVQVSDAGEWQEVSAGCWAEAQS